MWRAFLPGLGYKHFQVLHWRSDLMITQLPRAIGILKTFIYIPSHRCGDGAYVAPIGNSVRAVADRARLRPK